MGGERNETDTETAAGTDPPDRRCGSRDPENAEGIRAGERLVRKGNKMDAAGTAQQMVELPGDVAPDPSPHDHPDLRKYEISG